MRNLNFFYKDESDARIGMGEAVRAWDRQPSRKVERYIGPVGVGNRDDIGSAP